MRVAYPPLGLTVQLAYRRPVALVETTTGEKYLVDGSGVILPQDDLDTDVATFVKQHGLIGIKGDGILRPARSEAGRRWKSMAGVHDAAPVNSRIPAAARLAGFLLEKARTIDKERQPEPEYPLINPMDPKGRGLFLKNAESTYILWGDAPGEENPGNPTAEEKWERLREWSKGEA